jgi:Flp pilus assembly pilin Flp
MVKRMLKNKKGQGLVEYALLIAGVALVGTIGVTMVGLKTNEMISAVAATLPGPNPESNRAIRTGALVEVRNQDGNAQVDFLQITLNNDGTEARQTDNMQGAGIDTGLADDIVQVFEVPLQ